MAEIFQGKILMKLALRKTLTNKILTKCGYYHISCSWWKYFGTGKIFDESPQVCQYFYLSEICVMQ